VAALGPAVAADTYEVGEDVAAAAEQVLGSATWAVLRPASPGKWLFDLSAANRAMLCEAGVPAQAIHVAGLPTGPDPGLFYSHRAGQPCGRFAALARLDVRGAA
jgi:copper oxidase (laccase) domain-containing protein